jgi:hypothetical protein
LAITLPQATFTLPDISYGVYIWHGPIMIALLDPVGMGAKRRLGHRHPACHDRLLDFVLVSRRKASLALEGPVPRQSFQWTQHRVICQNGRACDGRPQELVCPKGAFPLAPDRFLNMQSFNFDKLPDFAHIWEKVSPLTMTSPERGFALWSAVNGVVDADVPGVFVECGDAEPGPWSFAFFDGNHDGDGPSDDAKAVLECLADDALVVFHDLTSPFVERGLAVCRDAGFMCACSTPAGSWHRLRGNVNPSEHGRT